MQPPRVERLSYSLTPVEQKAIESKMLGRKVKAWIKPAGGITSIVIAAAFAGTIIAVACWNPKFEKTILGISLGSTAGICLVVGTIGGVILLARHGHNARQSHSVFKDIEEGARTPKDTDDFLIDILTKYREKIPEAERIAEENEWIRKLEKGLRAKANAAAMKLTSKSSQTALDKFKKNYIELSGLTRDELEEDLTVRNHLIEQNYLANKLFPVQAAE